MARVLGACEAEDGLDCSPELKPCPDVGTPDLKPEKVLSMETGWPARLLGRLQIDPNFFLAYVTLDGALTQTFAIQNLLGEETAPDDPEHVANNMLGVWDADDDFTGNPMGQPLARRYLGTLTGRF